MKHRSRTLRSLSATLAAATMLSASLVVAVPGATLAASCNVHEEGSTTVFPAIDAAKVTWQGQNAGCTLDLNATGSGNGLDGLRTFRAPIQNFTASSRPFNKAAESDNLWAWKIGGDAMTFQVSNDASMNFITQITAAQVQGIYNGSITNWSSLGGPSQAIIADCRIIGSGTRDDMLRLFAITDAAEQGACDSRLTTSSDEATAAATPFHIVYTSLANIGVPATKELKLSGGAPLAIGNAATFVTPSTLSVSNGTYPAPRELFLAVNKFSTLPANTNTDNTNYVKAYDFINFMASSAGQTFMAGKNFVTVAPFVPFPAADVDLNGVVALGDLGKITNRWATGDSTPGWVRADADKNGTIAIGDIGIVTNKWSLSGPGNAFVAPN
jgi:ABC-type phosphate transport system substrate-binding protein